MNRSRDWLRGDKFYCSKDRRTRAGHDNDDTNTNGRYTTPPRSSRRSLYATIVIYGSYFYLKAASDFVLRRKLLFDSMTINLPSSSITKSTSALDLLLQNLTHTSVCQLGEDKILIQAADILPQMGSKRQMGDVNKHC